MQLELGRFLLGGWLASGHQKVLVYIFLPLAAVSHRAVPARLLILPGQLTGTIDHGYGWGCQGLPCVFGTFGQDLITVSGTLPSSVYQPCFFCPVGLIMPLLVLWLRAGRLPGVCV